MPSNSLAGLATLAPLILYPLGHLAVLAACIFGAMHPSLRREFIWFGLSALLRCGASLLTLVPQILMMAHASSSSISDVRVWYELSSWVGVISLVFLLVGTILLAVRARTVPVLRN